MTIEEIKALIQTESYDFLRTNPSLGDHVILLGLGGSHAYGTNVEGSDVDIRGVALNTKQEILLGRGFDQVEDKETDTVIYSFRKIIKLLSDANPNVLELLCLEPEQYLYLSDIGKALVENKKMFFSKKVLYTFGGYAHAQLRRLDNKTMRTLSQAEQEKHILNSIENARHMFPEKYFQYPEDAISLYIDDSVNPEYETEIFMDVNLKHYPLRDYKCMWSEMHNIVKDYGKLGKRASHALLHGKVNKHAMHLVRLLKMAIEVLTTGDMHTCRKDDHDLLMAIRNGEFMKEDGQLSDEFFSMVDHLEDELALSSSLSSIPATPDYKAIDRFVCDVNEKIVQGQ